MCRETGAAYAMVGRGALADPWIFSGRRVGRAEAARFLVDYTDTMRDRQQWPAGGIVARLKQLLRHWTAGGLVPDEAARTVWLRERDGAALLARLRAISAGEDAREGLDEDTVGLRDGVDGAPTYVAIRPDQERSLGGDLRDA
jgi:tRNA-dihydrouridine synthase